MAIVTATPVNPAPQPAAPPTLTADQNSAYTLMLNTLSSWGLSDLAADLKNFIIKGDTNPDTLALELSQTTAYKQRFPANALRTAKGLPELQPAQYISLEEQYRNVLQSYGLPRGFYDSHVDFTNMIANDLSPNELQTRAQVAHDQYTSAPSYMKELWTQYFGSKGDALAMILDPQVATSIIQDRANQVSIGGAAAASGLHINQGRAQQFQQAGVTLAGAQQAYRQIAAVASTDRTIAHRFGTSFSQADEENDLLLGQARPAAKRENLYNEEQDLFKSAGGLDQNALGVSQSY